MKKILLILFLFPAAYIYGKPENSGEALKKQDAITQFWNWFRQNETRLRNFESDPDKYLGELLTQIKKVKEGLAIELERPQQGIINMTVSADGAEELFPMVESVIAKAPVIKGWKFIAFRQRMDPAVIKTFVLKAYNRELDPKKMKFYALTNGNALDIIVFVAGVTEENYNEIAYAGLLLLDNILGEYDCVKKVRSYDFHALPEKQEELADLKPLLELAKYVDEYYKMRNKK